MRTKNRFIAGLIATLSFALASCNYLDVEPEYIMSPESFYETEDEVLYGLVGVYGVINSEALYGNYYTLMLSNADDLCYENRSQSGTNPHYYNHSASDSQVYATWSKLYEGVKNANEYMEAIEGNEFDSEGKYSAEARFLRAYYYFILAQTWGDVPLRTTSATSPSNVAMAATSQCEVMEWCVAEMKATLDYFAEGDITSAPYRVTRSAVQGILARVYLFLAGIVDDEDEQRLMWEGAATYAGDLIDSQLHGLNPSYSQLFINMISDIYDKEYNESIWEADFLGNHSAGSWSNGRIGDLIGLQSTSSDTSNFADWSCNYSYGKYNGSLKLWDLYWATDRTSEEANDSQITDSRQEWNLPPYNYIGYSGSYYEACVASYDKTPYIYNKENSLETPIAGAGQRNAGKYRRETIYEGSMSSKELYTSINFPILRYADVLLMYAEACNELERTGEAYTATEMVRSRAGIATKPQGEYDQSSLREMIRNERGRELAFEGLRKYDLIRWGIFVSAMSNHSSWTTDSRWSENATATRAAAIWNNVMPKHTVMPIPTMELGVNTLLKQNDLW